MLIQNIQYSLGRSVRIKIKTKNFIPSIRGEFPFEFGIFKFELALLTELKISIEPQMEALINKIIIFKVENFMNF